MSEEPAGDHSGWRAEFGQWMAERPWRARTAPLFVYALILWPVEVLSTSQPSTYPAVYAVQCLVVIAVVLSSRRLLPELNLRFHWLAVPAGLIGACAWIFFRIWLADVHIPWFSQPQKVLEHMTPDIRRISLALRLGGMILLAPIMEELFFRSLVLRSCSRAKFTWLAIVAYCRDTPGLGVLVTGRPFRPRQGPAPSILAREFRRTALGHLNAFNVSVMILLWCVVSHRPEDWPATVICGLLYAFVLRAGNSSGKSRGLGPAIWAHAITNAALWFYAVQTSQWALLQ